MGGDIALWMLALLVGMILFGVHIGVAFAICSALGVWLMLGSMEAALAILGNTAYEAVRFGIDMPDEIPLTTQERAYTSPIWYTP